MQFPVDPFVLTTNTSREGGQGGAQFAPQAAKRCKSAADEEWPAARARVYQAIATARSTATPTPFS
jgi:hypothetical protein